MRFLAIIILFLAGNPCFAQSGYRIYGKITNDQLEPLPLATIQVKGLGPGVLSNEKGQYSIEVTNGVHEVAVTMVGYKPQLMRVPINQADYEQNFIMENDESLLEEVVVTRRYKDPAEALVRAVIGNKEKIMGAAGNYSVEAYTRAVQLDTSSRLSRAQRDTARFDSVQMRQMEQFNDMALAEVSSRIDHGSGNKIREERTGVSRRGDTRHLFYLTATDGNFDIYQNLIQVPALSPTPFLSPISYSGLVAYRFRTIHIERVRKHRHITIQIIPGRLTNATVEGEMVIDDSALSVLRSTLRFPKQHLAVFDFFQVSQKSEWIADTAWMVTQKRFDYGSSSTKGMVNSYTDVRYKNFELNKQFASNYFGNELSAATEQAYNRDSTFWMQHRNEPLTANELAFVKYKDSIHAYVTSEAYLDSVDGVLNRIRVKNILWAGQQRVNHRDGTRWSFPSLISLIQPFSYGGPRLQPYVQFNQYSPRTRKQYRVVALPSYGFLNKDLNGRLYFYHLYNPFTRAHFNINAGRDFSTIYAGDAWINQLKRSNYYLNTSVEGNWGREVFNGFNFLVGLEVAFRRSLKDYKTMEQVDEFWGDAITDNVAVPFEPYNATYGRVEFRYTPFQKYIREPKEKIILGSDYPTFFTSFRKGLPKLFGSNIDFDYWEVGMQQTLKLGVTGISSYTFRSGEFLNTKRLERVDYKFQRQGDPFLFLNPNMAFQALDSTFPVFKRFYEFHYLHEFNGALLSKIPLLNKLQLKEVAGGGFLLAPERNLRYFEAFTGIERAFKWPFNAQQKFKLGVYVTGAVSNKEINNLQFKVGLTTWDLISNTWR